MSAGNPTGAPAPRRRPIVALAALAAATALAAAPSPAATTSDTSPTFFVEFELADGKFKGKIKSSKSKCEKGRKVVLVRKRNGDKKKLGTDSTNGKGKFSIGVGGDPKDGNYFAQAKGTSGCAEAKSSKVEIS